MTPMSGDPMQRRIMQLFPWIFTIFSLSFPAGLVLYWTVNNVLTIIDNRGIIGNDPLTRLGLGFFPANSPNNYVFGSGLWVGGSAGWVRDTIRRQRWRLL